MEIENIRMLAEDSNNHGYCNDWCSEDRRDLALHVPHQLRHPQHHLLVSE